ncbi:hypothetical protein LCGC14_2572770 [marine sediment metagenome]|uniref:Uncharacterized protein n=1 Tax=marine sediment metagenome TaxID=412755 RepID=A0A0F9AH67_9ZZZZ
MEDEKRRALMAGVVVEGADGSGKTTLIRAIRDKFHWPVVHVVQPNNPDILQMIKLAECAPVVFDRFHLSPVVYGAALREGPELTLYDLWALDGLLMNKGFVVVYCETDLGTMLFNNSKEEQLWEAVRKPEPLKEIVDQYLAILEQTSTFWCVYDYKTISLGRSLATLESFTRPEGPKGVLGHQQPDIWFVGDARADKGTRGLTLPFYDVGISDKLISGTLLHKALISNDLTWGSGVALSNSAGEDLRAVYSQLGEPAIVVALGRMAAGRLADAKIPAGYVSHPQWLRRFQHKNAVKIMTKEIRRAVE